MKVRRVVGNSLALAADLPTVERALHQMLNGLRAGGIAILHVLDVWALPDGPCVWHKSVRTTLAGKAALVIKGVHRCAGGARIELLVNDLDGDAPLRSQSVPLLGLEVADMERAISAGGARRTWFFGGYQEQPYDREKSTDLIMVVEK